MNRLLRTMPTSALSECGHIDGVRVWSWVIGAVLIGVVGASFFVPWTQTASGEGRVIAYSAMDRETPVKAPIAGRVVRWFVNEGDVVKAGQAIAELSDNDPDRVTRLRQGLSAVRSQSSALRTAITIADTQVRALEQARDAALENARLKVGIARDKTDASRQKLVAAQAKKRVAKVNVDRQRSLNKRDLASDRQLELAELGFATAKTELQRARASLRAAKREIKSAQARLSEIRKTNKARIEKARGELAKLRADRSKVDGSIAGAQSKLARQQTQMVLRAPRAGRILAISARQGSEFVKAGQSIATMIPDTDQRAVEIWIDGNDAPLMRKGQKVRLQFEGWPAVQFVGWPSVAVGTFGGEVAFVDAAGRRDGKFRVVVVPDATEQPWPKAQYLRQGVRVRGWVMLNRVSVAYEVWRQLNGFPPAVSPPKDAKGGAK